MASDGVEISPTEQACPVIYSGTFIIEKSEISEQPTQPPSEPELELTSQTVPVTQLKIRCLLPQEAYENLMRNLQSERFLRNACSNPSTAYGLINLPVFGEITCQFNFARLFCPIQR